MITSKGRRYKPSAFKYMGLFKTCKKPEPTQYWKTSERDYSRLTEKLKAQRMDKWDKTPINRVNTLIIGVALYIELLFYVKIIF